MVKEATYRGETVYLCEECGFAYRERELAERCQAFCAEHGACNLEITAHGFVPET